MTTALEKTVDANEFEDYKTVRDIMDRTNKERPKAEDVAKLKKMLRDSPKLWRVAGDFSEHALHGVISNINGTPFVVESARAGVEKMQEELGYADAPPLERMMINQAALCWLRLNLVERAHATVTGENHTTEAGLYWDRRLANAQRRFTRAVESLAKVRTLTAAADLLDARARAASSASTANNMRTLKALTA